MQCAWNNTPGLKVGQAKKNGTPRFGPRGAARAAPNLAQRLGGFLLLHLLLALFLRLLLPSSEAGLLAVRILATSDPALRDALDRYRDDLAALVREKDAKLQSS